MDLNQSEEDIRKLLDEFFSTGFSLKDFCSVADQDEVVMQGWIDKYYPGQSTPDDDPFIDVNIVRDDRKAGRSKKQQSSEPMLFARIGDIELFREVSSTYLKSLKS